MSQRKTVDVFQEDGTLRGIPEPLPPGEGMRLTYYTRHLPSGNVYPESALFRNRHAYERCLAKWNAQGRDMWHYTEQSPEKSVSNSPTDQPITCPEGTMTEEQRQVWANLMLEATWSRPECLTREEWRVLLAVNTELETLREKVRRQKKGTT